MKKIIAKNIGLFLQDMVTGTSINKKYFELQKTEHYTQEEIYSYQLIKLKKLLINAYENISYYKELMDKYILNPYTLNTLDELNKLPCSTKFILQNYDVTNNNISKVKIGKTGGTTGIPLQIIKDTKTRSYTWAAYYRWYNWMGIEFGDKVISLWGTPTTSKISMQRSIYRKMSDYLTNNYEINTFEMNPKSIVEVVSFIREEKPKLLKGYLSSLLSIANYVLKHNIKLVIPNISSTTATLFPHDRVKLKKAFNGDVYDQYGCAEANSIAFECSHHEGLHITSERTIIEVVDEDNNIIYDAPGEVVITDLDNYAMPIIRYKNGDIAILSTKLCSCGMKTPLLTKIVGRTTDTIKLKSGAKVPGWFFTNIFYELDYPSELMKINRFQCYQKKENYLVVKLEVLEEINQSFLIDLENSLKNFIDYITIEVLKEIPNEKSGKFKYIKSTLD